jgi:LysM repeat protein
MRARKVRFAQKSAALALAALATTAEAGDPLVLVERVVDARYGKTEQANVDFEQGVHSPLRFVYKVQPGDSLQKIADAAFGVNPKKTPATYAKLEDAIKQWNNLTNANRVEAGQSLVLPELPPRATLKPGQQVAQAGTQFADVTLGSTWAEVLNGEAYDFKLGAAKSNKFAALKEKYIPLVRQLMWIPASKAREDKSLTVLAQPIQVRFGANAAPGAAGDLASDVTVLKQYATSHSVVHPSVVYVLDDSWPDQGAFAESLQFLKQADLKIRQRFNLGAAAWDPALNTPNPLTTFPWIAAGGISHASQIKQAVAAFSTVTNSVKVIYIPLFTNQGNSAAVLKEIIFLSFVARFKQNDLESPLAPAALQKYIDDANKQTADVMKSLPTNQSAKPAATDQAVITGVLWFAQLYSQATGAPFFLNTSWVVDKYEFDFGPPPNLMGVTLAAVGDDPNMDIFKTNVLLASHARKSPGNVVAIMNNHPDGSSDGCTSYWTPMDPSPVYGLTYDGFLSPSLCGTSFSTPRIAWVLAFRETFRAAVGDADQFNWYGKYQDFILSLQDPTRPKVLRYWFSPSAVMQKP